jgi:tetratricopeptide (TPR) repeat protein
MLDAALAIALTVWSACPPTGPPNLDAEFASIAQGWDEARYGISDERTQIVALGLLTVQLASLAERYPCDARIRVWQGVILAGEADDSDWIDALRLAGEARSVLQSVSGAPLDRDATIMREVTLGALYAQAPPFPISFGDAREAEAHFRRALAVDPNGLEPNYYFADFLFRQHRYREANTVAQTALRAAPRANRDLGDRGERGDLTELLAAIRNARSP